MEYSGYYNLSLLSLLLGGIVNTGLILAFFSLKTGKQMDIVSSSNWREKKLSGAQERAASMGGIT